MINRILILFFALSAYSGFGQAWERLYTVDAPNEHLTLDGTDYGSGFLKLVLVKDRDSLEFKSANITQVDRKAAIGWSRDFVLEDSLVLLEEGDLEVLDNGNIAMSLVGVKDSLNHFVSMMDPAGNIMWSKQYAIYQDSVGFDGFKPRLVQSKFDPQGLFQAGIGLNEGVAQIFVSKISATDGQVQWSNYVGKEGGELTFGAITACQNGGLLIVGIDNATQQFIITKIAEDGSLVYNKSVTTNAIATNSVANSIIELADSTIVLAGSYFATGFEFDGYVVKLDTLANVQWNKKIDYIGVRQDVILLDLLQSDDGNILVSGKAWGALDTAGIGIKLDLNGDEMWTSNFKSTDLDYLNLGGLGQANNGGMSFFWTGENRNNQYVANISTTLEDGTTPCNAPIDSMVVTNKEFMSDTLELISKPYKPTYNEFCCESSYYLGDDRENSPNKIKIFDGFTYLITSNGLPGEETFAAFTKLDANNEEVWTFEFEQGTSIRDFVKINATEFMLVGNTTPYGFDVNNQSILVKIDDDGNLVGGGSLDNSGRENFGKILFHPNAMDSDFPIFIGGLRNYAENPPSSIDQSLVLNIDENFNLNWKKAYDLDSLDTQFNQISLADNGNVLLYGNSAPMMGSSIVEIDQSTGDVVNSVQTDSLQNYTEVLQLGNGNYIAIGRIRYAAGDVAMISMLNANYELLSGWTFPEVGGFNEMSVGSDGRVYVPGITNDLNPFVAVFSGFNVGAIVLDETRAIRIDLDDNTSPTIDIDGNQMAYASGWNIGNGSREVVMFNGPIDEALDCFDFHDLDVESFTDTLRAVSVSSVSDTLNLFEPLTLRELDWEQNDFCTRVDFANCSTIDVTSTPRSEYSIAIVELEVRPFCANEPFIWTFDAFIDGATGYIWRNEDGDEIGMADTLTVFEEGEYTVEVLMGDDICYSLCDTAELAIFEEPTINIVQNNQILCDPGNQLILIAQTSAEAGLDSIIWSTGEVGNSIIISPPSMTYTATIVDNCGIEAVATFDPNFEDYPFEDSSVSIGSACVNGQLILTANTSGMAGGDSLVWSTGETQSSITINPPYDMPYTVTFVDNCNREYTATFDPDFDPPQVDIAQDDSILCDTGQLILTAVASGGTGNLGSIVWSTGEVGPTITVSPPSALYTVSVVDECGIEGSASFATNFDILTAPDPMVSQTDGLYCVDGTITLIVTPSDLISYNWSNGATTDTIYVSDNETLDLTVTDECGLTTTISVDPDFDLVNDECSLEWPNVFTPDFNDMSNAEGYNLGFGPYTDSPAGVNDYTLKVYNRWGEVVFESDDIEEKWDGTYKDKDQPGDVYIYISEYNIFGREMLDKGDVTLLR